MNERLKELRNALKLTQEEFGNRIKVKRNTIAKYETNKGNPIDTVVFSICREFGVNEKWLRDGEGEMLLTSEGGLVEQIAKAYNLTPLTKAMLEGFLLLPEEDKKSILQHVRGAVALMNMPQAASADMPGFIDSASATNEEIASTRSMILEEIDNAPISDIEKMKLLNKTSEIFNKAFPAAAYASDTGGQSRSKFMGDTVRVFMAAHTHEDGADASRANEPAYVDIPRDLYNKIRSAKPLDEETDRDIL